MTAPDPLECLNSRAAAGQPTCGEPESAHCVGGCEMCPDACTCKPTTERRLVYADPDFGHEYDENGENKTNVYAGWDLAFGCRVNFTLDDDGAPTASVSLSDQAWHDRGCNRSVTREQIRAFAYHLIQMTDEMADPNVIFTCRENS